MAVKRDFSSLMCYHNTTCAHVRIWMYTSNVIGVTVVDALEILQEIHHRNMNNEPCAHAGHECIVSGHTL